MLMMAAVQSREREGTYRVTLTDMHELIARQSEGFVVGE